MLDILPDFLVKNIQTHIREQSLEGEFGWEHANEEEDTLTGDYLSQLRTNWNNSSDWKWRIKYTKVRGRGPGAYEKKIGADGIITIEFENNGERTYKSIIFQSKKKGNNNIKEQLKKMDDTLPDGNMVLVFTPRGYFAERGSEFTNDRNMNIRAGDYLADEFIGCKNGQWGVEYDGGRKSLKIGEKKIPRVFIKHKLNLEIIQRK